MSQRSSGLSSASFPAAARKIALGCVTFGREIERVASFDLLDHAFARGVRCFDTAAAYGAGASETILGEWLAAHRDARPQLTIATKLLPPYSAARIESELRGSLQRLGVERVDLLFLHQWHPSALEPETLLSLHNLVRRGEVGAIGLSNVDATQLDEFLQHTAEGGLVPPRAVQNVHNFAVRGFDRALAARCAEARVTTFGYSPLGAGFLTGKHRAGVEPGSRFALIPGHQAIYFTAPARARLDQLQAVAARTGLPLVPLALAWALREPRIDFVLVGGRTTAQLDQAFVALDLVTHDIFAGLGEA